MLTMLDDKVAIKPLEDPDITEGGIIIPDVAKQREDQGIVIYKGPNVKHVKIGMHVLFNGYAGTHVAVDGEGLYTIMHEEAVSCVIEDSRDWVFTGRKLRQIFKQLREDIPEEDLDGRVLMDEAADYIMGSLKSDFFAEGIRF